MKKNIAVIDYGIGNVKSILGALHKVGANAFLSRDCAEILNADAVVLPGVGAFKHGMDMLVENQLDECIKEYIKTNKPFLGVCLGMQLMLTESHEFGVTKGLGIIPGVVEKLTVDTEFGGKLPHVGWNEIMPVHESEDWNNTILSNIKINEDMYFVHSYEVKPDNDLHILSVTEYSNNRFCSAVVKNNVFGCQFHPEKSGDIGLQIINNFVNLCGKSYV